MRHKMTVWFTITGCAYSVCSVPYLKAWTITIHTEGGQIVKLFSITIPNNVAWKMGGYFFELLII